MNGSLEWNNNGRCFTSEKRNRRDIKPHIAPRSKLVLLNFSDVLLLNFCSSILHE
jgi:hypothetical protein